MKELHLLSANALYAQFEANEPVRHARLLCRLIRASRVDVASAIRSHLFGDDWLDFAHASLRSHFGRCSGEVYLAASEDHPGLVKVGKTGRSARERVHGLNKETVLQPFELLAAVVTHDRHWVELQAHRQLQQAGVGRIKEFFAAPPALLLQCVHEVAYADRQLFNKHGFGLAIPAFGPQ